MQFASLWWEKITKFNEQSQKEIQGFYQTVSGLKEQKWLMHCRKKLKRFMIFSNLSQEKKNLPMINTKNAKFPKWLQLKNLKIDRLEEIAKFSSQ